MTPPRPWIIVSLPARTVSEIRAELVEAAASGADLAEVRLDRWPSAEIEDLASLFPSPVPLFATYRSRAEGGEGSDDPSERARIFRRVEALPFAAFDRESDRDPSPDPSVSGVTVWSRHFGPGASAAAAWDALRARPEEPGLRKVVLGATLRGALDLLDQRPPTGLEGTILQTTGPSGALLRALTSRLGGAAVFASLPSRPHRDPVEPAQIPVDRLTRFLGEGPTSPLFALLGSDVTGSLSPAIYAEWMRALREPGLYLALGVHSVDELTNVLPRLTAWGFAGFNVTRPWKVAALAVADEVRPGARACGSANVITVEPSGATIAENSDLAALLRRLSELREAGRWDGGSMLTVGSGGAARAALAAAKSCRARSLLLGRDPERVRSLAAEFGARPAVPGEPPPGLIVHASAFGHTDAGAAGFDLEPWIRPNTHLLDLVYRPDDPAVHEWAERKGAEYEDGLRLLVYQAAANFGLWFGRKVPEALIDETIGKLR